MSAVNASISPCLVFEKNTEAAVNLYVSVIKNSRIVSLQKSAGGPIPAGQVMHCAFELNGVRLTAFDGGPHFKFTDAFSLVATCETQAELDEVWSRLSEGGKEVQCGWLMDRFGLSWQVIPAGLGKMLSDSKSGNSAKAVEAMLKMVKLDIAALEKAYSQQ